MTDDEFGVPVADRLPLSQRQIVEAWNTQQAERQRKRAEAQEAFKRDVFLPLWQEAEAQIKAAQDALPVPFVGEWIRASTLQRALDTRYAASASVQTLDAARVRAAVAAWVAATLDMYREFEAVVQRRACPICGSLNECPHDAPPSGGEVEALYPATPRRLLRPQD